MTTTMDAQALSGWLAVLDKLSYYDLLGVPKSATHDDLRRAFHAFAETFHPDAHRARPPNEQGAVETIFKRGAEAFRVLSEPGLRAQYDQALTLVTDQGSARAAVATRTVTTNSIAPAPARLLDTVRSPGARPFVLRAEELAKKGDFKQAKLQLTMALHMERGNVRLEAFAKELDENAKKQAADEKSSWKK
ncbi:MAG: DnaJ domain-containing protein [Myxococcales bacterium]|nr:DnaJ domain-containing protein [Myxococcales bacterium]